MNTATTTYTIQRTPSFETHKQDADPPAPLFHGLPDDRYQCPHCGVVLTGKLVFRYADHGEIYYHAGDAYYGAPGHLPLVFAGSEFIEFSPTVELQQTIAVLGENMKTGRPVH